jgi:2-polyprenyl-3-methyl-5-hydroxy-6-metoxy-1,4-benzoquinol methylase
MEQEFTKYKQKGDYHWKMYDDPNTKYHRHANRVKDWIKERSVLDMGCGDGKITAMLGAYGIDNDKEGIRLAKEHGVGCEVMDCYDTNFASNNFEAVFMGDVLEHLEHPLRCLREVHRICKGYLYVAVPIPGMQKDPFHMNEPNARELKFLVETAGFKLEGEILEVRQDKRLYAKFKKI